MMHTFKKSLWVFAKLALAGASICAIAWAFAVFQPDGSVRESQADILDLSFIDLSNSTRFARGLEHLGHDEPQSFSINGNVVHFSVNRSRSRPEQLMKTYQEEFVHQGLNDKVWTHENARGSGNDMLLDAMTGGVVPVKMSRDYVALGGTIPGNDADDLEGLFSMVDEREPEELFKGHHYVEMFWDRYKRETTVTATWSDEKFNYRTMVEGGDAEHGYDVDVDVPSCPGCSRVSRIRALDPSSTYSSSTYAGRRPQDNLIGFYQRVLPRRGWVQTDSSRTFNAAKPYIEFEGSEASLLQYTKNGQFLTILGYPGKNGETLIHAVTTD